MRGTSPRNDIRPAVAGEVGDHQVLGGDSAGATLLLSMLLMLRERGETMPAGALLFSPWTDLAMRGWSYVTKGVSSDSPFRMETAAFAARRCCRSGGRFPMF